MNNMTTERVVGELTGTVKALQTDMVEVKATLKGQDDKLDKLIALHHQRKGALRFGKIIVGFVTSSGFAGWLWEHFHR